MIKNICYAAICIYLYSALATAGPSKSILTKMFVSTTARPESSQSVVVLTRRQLDAITSAGTNANLIAALPILVWNNSNGISAINRLDENPANVLNKTSYEQIVLYIDNWVQFTDILNYATPAHIGIHGQTTGGIVLGEQNVSSLPPTAADVTGIPTDTPMNSIIMDPIEPSMVVDSIESSSVEPVESSRIEPVESSGE